MGNRAYQYLWAYTLSYDFRLQKLLAKRVDPDSTDDGGNTPLHKSANREHARVIIIILNAGNHTLIMSFLSLLRKDDQFDAYCTVHTLVLKALLQDDVVL